MRRTQEGYSPFKDDKPKDTENSPFEASSVLVVKAIHMKYSDGKRSVIIPNHSEIAQGTLKSILSMANISLEDFMNKL